MSLPLLFLIHALLVYRVSRFIISDELIDGTRKKILHRLEASEPGTPTLRGNPREFFKDKAWSLLQCPYCVSMYVGGGTVLIHLWWLDGLPYPVWWWLGICAGALIVWTIVED